MVWAYNELEPMRATIAEVAASGIPVIWIEAPESLIDWEVQNWDKDKGTGSAKSFVMPVS
jgi:hypothetical protein